MGKIFLKHFHKQEVDKMAIKYKGINLRKETYEELSELGEFGDSFDDIINRILDVYKKNK